MGRSSDMAIAEANRNEAKEAIEILEKVQTELVLDFYPQAEQIEEAITLIKKFSDKHQPGVQRWK